MLNYIKQIQETIIRYGYLNTLKSSILTIFVILLAKILLDPNFLFESWQKWSELDHNSKMEIRIQNDPIIRLHLENIMNYSHADRAFILELRNGTVNSNGLPYAFFDMKYEVTTPEESYVDMNYQSMSLSRFEFASYLFRVRAWSGSIEDLGKIDSKLYQKMDKEGTKYIILGVLEGEGVESGVIGITYSRIPEKEDIDKALAKIYSLSQTVTDLLNVEPR